MHLLSTIASPREVNYHIYDTSFRSTYHGSNIDSSMMMVNVSSMVEKLVATTHYGHAHRKETLTASFGNWEYDGAIDSPSTSSSSLSFGPSISSTPRTTIHTLTAGSLHKVSACAHLQHALIRSSRARQEGSSRFLSIGSRNGARCFRACSCCRDYL